VALLAALVLVPVALAQGGYEITSWTVDGGGGTYSGGDYRLAGTIGQHDAAIWRGGDYTLAGGFWAGGAAGPGPGYEVFLPLVMRNH
jgi:hypothetical protein